MEHPDVALMVEVAAYIRTIDQALKQFRRSDTMGVLRAYRGVLTHEPSTTPCRHAYWIREFSRGENNILVVPRREASALANRLEMGMPLDDWIDRTTFDDVAFDPKHHALCCLDLSVASYMHGNPDHILGPDATVVSPMFKSALVWWTCE